LGLKPKLARLDAPGFLHHIIIRGIERGQIFRDDQDRDNLIDRLSILLSETQTAYYAWAYMYKSCTFFFPEQYGCAGCIICSVL
jgi:putative transposase